MADWYKIRNARTVPTVDGTGVINYHTMMGEVIRSFGRDDWVNFKPLFLKFLRLFGEAIESRAQLSHLTGCEAAWMAKATSTRPRDSVRERFLLFCALKFLSLCPVNKGEGAEALPEHEPRPS